jgi:hypothetical protein
MLLRAKLHRRTTFQNWNALAKGETEPTKAEKCVHLGGSDETQGNKQQTITSMYTILAINNAAAER